MGELSVLDYIIYSLLPFGQLFARIINYNGSLDAWWLLLIPFFHIPLLGFIPLLIMSLLKIKNGNVKTPIIDKYIFLPIIFKFYSPYIFPLLGIENKTYEYSIITYLFSIIHFPPLFC